MVCLMHVEKHELWFGRALSQRISIKALYDLQENKWSNIEPKKKIYIFEWLVHDYYYYSLSSWDTTIFIN